MFAQVMTVELLIPACTGPVGDTCDIFIDGPGKYLLVLMLQPIFLEILLVRLK